MSELLRQTIAARLVGAATLLPLVGEVPGLPGASAVVQGNRNTAPDVYPCLTYRLDMDTLDARFGETENGAAGSRVADVYLEAEYWTRFADSTPVEAVKDILDSLFDRKAFLVPGLGRVFQSRRQIAQCDHYDKARKCRFGLFRYHLRLQLAS